MNIKKLVVTTAAGAVMLSAVAMPALAAKNTTHVKNSGSIDNTSVNVANSGLNSATKGGEVKTGSATAVQLTGNGVVTSADSCGCNSKGKTTTTVKNTGGVDNLSVNVANSGLNSATKGGEVKTGSAFAGQGVVNVVNTSVN